MFGIERLKLRHAASEWPPLFGTLAFADSHPDELAFLGNISFPNAVMNALLAWGEDNQAEGNEMAGYFIVKHEELWSSWLPADVAAKVKAALQ